MNSSRSYKVHAIIVTFNGLRWVQPCLGSLMTSDYPVNTIVVDNCSTDETVAIIQQRFPSVRLIQNEINSGFGHANNIGIRAAMDDGADFVFLLNQDAWIQRDTIRKLVDAAAAFPEYGVISPLHVDGTGNNLDHGFANYLRQSGYDPQTIEDGTGHGVSPIDFVNAAAWFVSRKCLETVGGFGPLFIQYGEDRDYIQRMQFHGLKVGFIRSTKISHDRLGRSFDFSDKKKFVWYYYTGCLVRLADVNYPIVTVFAKVGIWCISDALKFLLNGRWYSPVAFTKVFFQIIKKMADILRYRDRLKTRQKLLFLEK